MEEIYKTGFGWYLDITPNRMFSLGDYPIQGNDGCYGIYKWFIPGLNNIYEFI